MNTICGINSSKVRKKVSPQTGAGDTDIQKQKLTGDGNTGLPQYLMNVFRLTGDVRDVCKRPQKSVARNIQEL